MPMQLEVTTETKLFLFACLLGVGMGITYDLLAIMRNVFPRGKVWIFIEDFLYSILFGFSYFVYCTGLTMGIRGFVLVGMLMGCMIERLSLGRLLVWAMTKFLEVIKRYILSPVAGLFAKIMRAIHKRIVKKCLIFFESKKNVEKPLQV